MNSIFMGAIILVVSIIISTQNILKIFKSRKSTKLNPDAPETINPDTSSFQNKKDTAQTQESQLNNIAKNEKVGVLKPYLILDYSVKLIDILESIKNMSHNIDQLILRIDHILIGSTESYVVWLNPKLSHILKGYQTTDEVEEAINTFEKSCQPLLANLQDTIATIFKKTPGLYRIFMIVEKGIFINVITQILTTVDNRPDVKSKSDETQYETTLLTRLIDEIKKHHYNIIPKSQNDKKHRRLEMTDGA